MFGIFDSLIKTSGLKPLVDTVKPVVKPAFGYLLPDDSSEQKEKTKGKGKGRKDQKRK